MNERTQPTNQTNRRMNENIEVKIAHLLHVYVRNRFTQTPLAAIQLHSKHQISSLLLFILFLFHLQNSLSCFQF